MARWKTGLLVAAVAMVVVLAGTWWYGPWRNSPGGGIGVEAGRPQQGESHVQLPIHCVAEGSAGVLQGAFDRELVVRLTYREQVEAYKVPISGFVKTGPSGQAAGKSAAK